MTKEEFQRWKHDGKEVWDIVKSIVRQKEYNLAREAGEDQLADRFNAGMIKGMEAVLEIDWEDQEDAES